jgi:ABC-2 type transport system permease protein
MTLRDRRLLFVAIVTPIALVNLLGAAFGGTSWTGMSIGIVDLDRSHASRTLVAGLRSQRALEIHLGDERGESAALQRGLRAAVIVLPRGLEQVALGFPARISVTASLDPRESLELRGLVSAALARLSPDSRGVDLKMKGHTTRRLRYIDFAIPGVVAVATMHISLHGALLSLVLRREQGILKRMMATPLPLSTLVAAKLVVVLAIALVQVCVILALGVIEFGCIIAGPLYALAAATGLGVVTFAGIGMVVSASVRSVQAAQHYAYAIGLPLMFLSGAFFPLRNMPAVMQSVASSLPLTGLVEAERAIVLRGAGVGNISTSLGLLTSWCLALGIGAVLLTHLRPTRLAE